MASVKSKKQPGGHIAVEGELTIYTVMALKEKLLAGLSENKELELDLSDVTEFDAAGLQLLVMIKKQAAVSGKVLRFTNHSPEVLNLLDLSGLAGFFGDPLLMVNPSKHAGR